MSHRQGFTLVELSMVMVIIGLIAAGILVGRDLIEAAYIRAQVAQIEKLNTAVNTFKGKYNGLPGDLSADDAATLGMAARSGGVGDGDNNGIIGTCGFDGLGGRYSGCENVIFWNDLGVAQLIAPDFPADATFPANPTGMDTSLFFPAGKVGKNTQIMVFSIDGVNAFALVHPGYVGNNQIWAAPVLSPLQAFAIDNKMDDGLPTSGRVTGSAEGINSIETDLGSFSDNLLGGGPYCMLNVEPVIYNTKGSDANKPLCIMNMNFQ